MQTHQQYFFNISVCAWEEHSEVIIKGPRTNTPEKLKFPSTPFLGLCPTCPRTEQLFWALVMSEIVKENCNLTQFSPAMLTSEANPQVRWISLEMDSASPESACYHPPNRQGRQGTEWALGRSNREQRWGTWELREFLGIPHHITSFSTISTTTYVLSCPTLHGFSLSTYHAKAATENMVQKQWHKMVSLASKSQKPKVTLGDSHEKPFSDLLSG